MTNPAFRGRPARRSLPEFQTTGRSREDDDEYEDEIPTASRESQTANGEPLTSPERPTDSRIREQSQCTLRNRRVYL
jgi:hypothetical protein